MSYAPLPTTAEARIIHAGIAAHEDDIAATELRIQDLERQISTFRANISTIRNAIAAKYSVIAPVRRLPFDVLGEIVTLCATDPDTPAHILRVFASICRTWRDAALRTPKAWSKIAFRHSSCSYNDTTHTDLATLQDFLEWFRRSGSSQKDVSLFCPSLPMIELDSLLAVVHLHMPYLRSFSLAYHGATPGFVSLLAGPLPNLQTLDLFHMESVEAEIRALSASNLPCLRNLRVPSLAGTIPESLQRQLWRLCVWKTNIEQLLKCSSLDSLRHLSVSFIRVDRPTQNIDNTPCALPQLLSLSLGLEMEIPVLASWFLSKLHTPRLESASLYQSTGPFAKQDAASILRAFMTALAPPLRVLYLRLFWLSDADLLQLLGKLPALEHLILDEAKHSDKVVEALSRPKNRRSGWLCPRLTHISISCAEIKSTKFKVSRKAMQTLADARRDAVQGALSRGHEPVVAALASVRQYDSHLVHDGSAWSWQPSLLDTTQQARAAWWNLRYHAEQAEEGY